ncbi:putative disease resistance protein [Spatholobus suberectus]|nr:putative disease resistance protein [Spatholobus suberectus]
MTIFRVLTCNKLKSLPCHMYTLLPNLRRLEIIDCLEIDSFPEGGLPPNLTSLEIRNCEKLLSSLSSMGKHEGLTLLNIGESESVKSFPKESLLPQLPSLRTLYLNGFKTMETLNCKGLLHLTSLEVLTIRNCPKLNNMATERLPPSLIKLQIYETPSLGRQCQEKHTEIWPKISHIRGIQVDGRWIC